MGDISHESIHSWLDCSAFPGRFPVDIPSNRPAEGIIFDLILSDLRDFKDFSDLSDLRVSNFAGTVIVRQGSAGVINIVAIKRAARAEDLDQLDVQMVVLQNGVEVSATNSLQLTQVSVDFEITAPLDVQPVIEVAAGSIDYEGSGIGQNSFTVAAGSVAVRLPADVNVEVLLTVGAGTISIGFPVVGLVEDQRIDGIIGTGVDGRIEASVAAGEIMVIPQ